MPPALGGLAGLAGPGLAAWATTTERVVVLNIPGRAQCEFKLRLAADPSPSDHFGPWHLADRVASPSAGEVIKNIPHDAFAIRYRVL